jgi:phosphatidylserine decarboxylase
MEIPGAFILGPILFLIILVMAYLFWRHLWFFRNPPRHAPFGEGILCPADGTVVYVERIPPKKPVISVKKGKKVSICDIAREDLHHTKILIGVFMSPFNVHHNRAPISGEVIFVKHSPPKFKNHHMGSMHWRALLRRFPIHANSPHILENERKVTKISGFFKTEPISCYVVQIAGGSVDGIETAVSEGERVERGQIFGMIRIGSQVDIIITYKQSMTISVKPGDRVRAGETVLIA